MSADILAWLRKKIGAHYIGGSLRGPCTQTESRVSALWEVYYGIERGEHSATAEGTGDGVTGDK